MAMGSSYICRETSQWVQVLLSVHAKQPSSAVEHSRHVVPLSK